MEHINSVVVRVCSQHRIRLGKGQAAVISARLDGRRDVKSILAEARNAFSAGAQQTAGRATKKQAKAVRAFLRQVLAQEGLAGLGEAAVCSVASTLGGRMPSQDEARALLQPHLDTLKEEQRRADEAALLAEIVRKTGALLPFQVFASDRLRNALRAGGEPAAAALIQEMHKERARKRAQDTGLKCLADFEGMVGRGDLKLAGLVRQVAVAAGSPQTQARRLAQLLGAGPEAANTLAEAVAVIETRAAKARREQAEADRKAKHDRVAWRKSLIGVAETRARLGATPTEIARWIAEGRIPIADHRNFYKWGRSLRTTLHEPAAVDAAKGMVPEWRAARQETLRQKRRAAASGSDDVEATVVRRRRALLRSAVPEASYDRIGVVVLQPAAMRIGLPSGLSASIRAPQVSLPWPAHLLVSHDGPPLRGHARSEAVRALRDSVAGVVGQTTSEILNAADSWKGRADAVVREYHADEQACLSDLLRHEVSKRSDIGYPQDASRASATVLQSLDAALAGAVTAHGRQRRLATLKRNTGLADYAALFPAARSMRRRIRLHLGPTNSGKTHAAMDQLAAAASGCYLAPLRLMALEGAERLNGSGVPTDLVTGEEHISAAGARHVSSTIEMADLSREVDVAVIDEIQMIADRDRGWAWTQAAVGIPARDVIMTGSMDALPYVVRIAEITGDEIDVRTFERKTPLEPLKTPVHLSDVRDGDAVVAFSRSEVMRVRAALAEKMPVAVVYGALSPEVRRNEARRFRSGEAKVLVATDAIAMGLNMPIRRVLFSAIQKFDGVTTRRLTDSEIRQIAGRAGRYGIAERGEAGVLAGLPPDRIAAALSGQPEQFGDDRLLVMPPWRAVQAVSEALGTVRLAAILSYVASTVLHADPTLRPASLDGVLAIARTVDTSGLELRERFGYLGCPVDTRHAAGMQDIAAWSRAHARGAWNSSPRCSVTRTPETDADLALCETAVKRMTAYLWLAMRWPAAYPEQEAALADRERGNALIEGALKRKALARTCRECGARLPKAHAFPICNACFESRHNRYDDGDTW